MMTKITKTIDSSQIQRQLELCRELRERLMSDEKSLLAMVDT